MELADYLGKCFALISTDENDDAVAYSGSIASTAGDTLYLEREGSSVTLETEWLGRIRPVSTEHTAILPDTDFWIPLTVGPTSQDEATDLPTGMKWPL